MNDYALPQGDGDSPVVVPDSTPPDMDFKALNMHVDSVASFGDAMVAEADHVGTHAKKIKARLKVPEADKYGQYTESPFGADKRQSTLHKIAKDHNQRITEMHSYLDNVQTGIRNLGLISQAIAAQFGDQDALNGADVNAIGQIVDGSDAKPPAGDVSTTDGSAVQGGSTPGQGEQHG